MGGAAIVVMGVSGSGKSTVGAALAEALGLAFVDGDDLHPPANVAKMAAGVPLDDDDRAPWLRAVGLRLAEGEVVVACSALRVRYRDRLRELATGTRFVFLDLDRDELARRLGQRPGHFMPASLLDSQLAALERPDASEGVLTVPGDLAASDVHALVVAALADGRW
ncbi:gluconokinase [Agromyces sp. MMS24-JH15]|uniref:gluconokinase n=1 Tax=Agromyces sp. MMS24-JH15 TaxID=3243765 RepID=UPI0037482EED